MAEPEPDPLDQLPMTRGDLKEFKQQLYVELRTGFKQVAETFVNAKGGTDMKKTLTELATASPALAQAKRLNEETAAMASDIRTWVWEALTRLRNAKIGDPKSGGA